MVEDNFPLKEESRKFSRFF